MTATNSERSFNEVATPALAEQYLCAALLRQGKAVASDGTVGLLSRLLPRLRRAFPRTRILVRLDGGFASPAVFAFLEAQPRLDYVIAMAKNAVLERYAEPAMLVARARTWRSEQTEHVEAARELGQRRVRWSGVSESARQPDRRRPTFDDHRRRQLMDDWMVYLASDRRQVVPFHR